MAHPRLIDHYWLSKTAADERAQMSARVVYEQHKAKQDARTHKREIQQAIDEEGCGVVFAAIATSA